MAGAAYTDLAEARLDAGDIPGARAALVDAVRAHPRDLGSQMFLFQLMALQGEWEKAQARLRAIVALDPAYRLLGLVYEGAIRAEAVRAAAFAAREPPYLLASPSDWAEAFAAAFPAALAGDPDAVAARDAAADQALEISGRWNDQEFDWLVDTDDRFGPMLEAVVDGRWGLIPFEGIAEIRSEGPRELRDLVWLPAHIVLRSGERAAALLPVRYPGAEQETDATLRLARQTVWQDGPQGVTARGQHVICGGEDLDFDLLSLRTLVLAA